MSLCCSWLPLGFVLPVFRVPLVAPSSGTFSSVALSAYPIWASWASGWDWMAKPASLLAEELSPVPPLQPFPFLVHCFSAWKAQPKVVLERKKDKDALKLMNVTKPSLRCFLCVLFFLFNTHEHPLDQRGSISLSFLFFSFPTPQNVLH